MTKGVAREFELAGSEQWEGGELEGGIFEYKHLALSFPEMLCKKRFYKQFILPVQYIFCIL